MGGLLGPGYLVRPLRNEEVCWKVVLASQALGGRLEADIQISEDYPLKLHATFTLIFCVESHATIGAEISREAHDIMILIGPFSPGINIHISLVGVWYQV